MKSNQSEVFYNSKQQKNNAEALLPSSNQVRHISKSYGDKLDENPIRGVGVGGGISYFERNRGSNSNEKQLQDSLKLIRNNSSSSANSVNNSNNNKPVVRPIGAGGRDLVNSCSSSSSTSSVASSNDDDTRVQTEEKLKKREAKEIGTLIDQLTMTLKAVSRIQNTSVDSEVDEVVKDNEDVIEEVEESVELKNMESRSQAKRASYEQQQQQVSPKRDVRINSSDGKIKLWLKFCIYNITIK